MRKRYLYLLLFLVPGGTIALLVTGGIFGAVAGALWLFVYGDSPWPAWTEWLLPWLMLAVFLGLWIAAATTGYSVGKRLEAEPGFNARHFWIALVATVLPILLVLMHQISVGNLGPKSDGQRCSEYCSDQGYASSSLPPRDSGVQTCSCLGARGEAGITVQIDALPR